jgi:uncharacterized protein YbjT (DUF2867 family)
MRIVVFGATGSTGLQVVEQALAAGHDVVAVARRPERIAPRPHLTARPGDVLDAASLPDSCRDAGAVVSCIGPSSNRRPGRLMSVSTANMVAAAEEAGVGRFVLQSGIGLSDGTDLSRANRLLLAALWRPLFADAIGDKAEAERRLRASALQWVIVRPVILRDAPARGRVLAGPRARVSLLATISYAECAACLLRAVNDNAWALQVVNVGRG